MRINIRNKNDHRVFNWAGGTTTQLLIFPEDAEYGKRNFQWRISSAKIELEESTFTPFPKYNRILMVLEGNLRIEHEGHYSILLEPLQQDQFKGEWITKSYGRAVDFNLIMNNSCSGEIETYRIPENEILSVPKAKNKEAYQFITESFYIIEGYADVKINKKDFHSIQKGGILSITRATTEAQTAIEIVNPKAENSIIIRSILYY